MYPRITNVQTDENFTLLLSFDNGEQRRFDVTPYLNKGIFQQLKDLEAFSKARNSMGTVCWPGGQDFCPDTLYLESTPLAEEIKAVAEDSPEYGTEN